MKTKLSMAEDKLLVIENYEKIIELKNDFIKIDYYNIYGSDLKIGEMDDYMILIKGLIKEIRVINEKDNNK